jgi:hypothetical protein
MACGSLYAAASAVGSTEYLPAGGGPSSWLRLLCEPVLCAIRPPPLASKAFLPPDYPPAPPPAKLANAVATNS